MWRVTQTSFGHDPKKPDIGNCFSACIAGLLETPVRCVPVFAKHEDWYGETNLWLAERCGLHLLQVGPCDYDEKIHRGYCIIGGRSPRGDWGHACIGHDGQIVWDVHPDRTGLDKVEDYGYLIPLDPSKRGDNQ